MRIAIPMIASMILLLFVSSCGTPEEPELRGVSGFKMNRKNENKQLQFEFNLRIFNPNKFKIKLKKYDLEVSLNGSTLGNATGTPGYVLKGFSENEYYFVVKSDAAKLTGSLLKIIAGFATGSKEIKVKVKGMVQSKSRGISREFYLSKESELSL